MDATSLPTLVGLVAGCMSSWSLVPQLLKCWREGLTEAVSKRMFAARAFGLVLWGIYGYFAGSLPVVIFSSINLVLSIAILVLTGLSGLFDLSVLRDIGLWGLAVATTITVVQRIVEVHRQARRLPAQPRVD